MRKVFIICSVRDADPEYRAKLEAYADMLEDNGAEVHLPHRHIDQKATGFEICQQNAMAINLSNEVHIFYNPLSQGTHFVLGIAFALNQITGKEIQIVAVDVEIERDGKSFPKMIGEWMNMQSPGKQEVEDLDFPGAFI